MANKWQTLSALGLHGLGLAGILSVFAGGCAQGVAETGVAAEETLDAELPFVAVEKGETQAAGLTTQATQLRTLAGATAGDQDFYLAINKNELGKRWFLSAFIKQFFPGAVGAAAARSLSTRVVTFKIQNGKLFVFDADDRRTTSDNFAPELLVDAFPIITDFRPFTSRPGANQFVLFDPAAGLAKIDVLSDGYGAGGVKYETDLKFLQRFRRIQDGVTWEQVFTGTTDVGDPSSFQQIEDNQFRTSGTLGIALRRYTEGQGFTPVELPPQEHYFRGDLRLVPNTGTVAQNPAKWNIRRGMRPIKWVISDQILVAQRQWPQYDLVGTVKRGIESWNEAFGFEVFKAEVGNADTSWADDDTNVLIWDNDPSLGFAFANWRTNPNTGEIRGASVFMNSIWVEGADEFFPADGSPTQLRPQSSIKLAEKKERPRLLGWSGAREHRLCELEPEFHLFGDEGPVRGTNPAPGTPLTKKQKVENYIQHTVAHEIGHTLSLRHNFKGSLTGGPGSSVMDYVGAEESVFAPNPLPYDIDAVKYLYNLSTELPKQPFCTDNGTRLDPDCTQFDSGTDPFNDLYIPLYIGFTDQFLTGLSATPPNNSLNNVLKYARASADPAIRLRALEVALNGSRIGTLTAQQLGDPRYAARADFMARAVYNRLFLDDPTVRGNFRADPPVALDPALRAAIVADLGATLRNEDGIRRAATRRAAVDILKKLQTADAFEALRSGRARIADLRVQETGVAAAESDDLLARIDRAMTPYFN